MEPFVIVDEVEFEEEEEENEEEDEEEVAVKGATELPAAEQVEMNADCATDAALPLHMLAIACCTSVALLPQIAERSPG